MSRISYRLNTDSGISKVFAHLDSRWSYWWIPKENHWIAGAQRFMGTEIYMSRILCEEDFRHRELTRLT